MKKALGLAIMMLFVGSTAAMAQTVVGSSHDMTDILGVSASTDEVCKYCHAPHNRAEYALWNRAAPAGPYTLYSSPTIQMTIATPGDASLACLSCHDGSIAYDAYTGNATPDGTVMLPGNTAYIGTDLSNDHPVGVTYDITADTRFQAPTDAILYGASSDQVECASCHNPHDQATYGNFLIASNAASALCVDCHLK